MSHPDLFHGLVIEKLDRLEEVGIDTRDRVIRLETRFVAIEERAGDHETRLRTIEAADTRRSKWAAAIAAAISGVVSWVTGRSLP